MLSFFAKSRSVLGMNARNLRYLQPNNSRRARRLADDKLLSKKILKKGNLPFPKFLAAISSHEELERFPWETLPATFALKPNRGFGGGGIVVVYAKSKKETNVWIKADGSKITVDDLRDHIRNILEGTFSLSGTPDIAFFEERLKLSKTFKPYAFKGIPDIRIIVYNRVPVMAMLRLPTKESGGKANLHQGAIGVGIDMAHGITTTAVWGKRSRLIETLPGTRLSLSGIRIPFWQDILRFAVEAQTVSGLGFLGADIAVDRERGPVFLELNARPGLQIQVANQSGLKERLLRVEGLKIKSVSHGVRVGKNLFGGEVEESLEEISGRKVIGTTESITLIGKNGKEIQVKAKIDTGAYSTSIDETLAKRLGYGETLEHFAQIDQSQYTITRGKLEEIREDIIRRYGKSLPSLNDISLIHSASGSTLRPVIQIEFVMDAARVVSKANIVDRANLQYPVLIGRRDLKKFLIEVK
jgi:alpha-L-glutamate ligase-like protein